MIGFNLNRVITMQGRFIGIIERLSVHLSTSHNPDYMQRK